MSADTMPCGCEGHADNSDLCRYPAMKAERDKLATENAALVAKVSKLKQALEEVDTIACREVSSGRPEDPPDPANRDGEELSMVVRAALKEMEGAP